ncbi:DUF6551 family protein [Mycobacterium sp. NPDC006124]|uniref:DUF6551 family protein n=1 Tax=Mycobacterium sp. NPDC006124 TaxID=3156729 RepID=UPI0033A20C2D
MTAPHPVAPYVLAIPVTELFVDHTYQRPLDPQRVRTMSASFDPKLLGVIEVSDRGPERRPRYAVIEGQHRWATVAAMDSAASIAARVHSGLSIAEEAQLFLGIDVHRRRLSTWNRWKARRAQGDPDVAAIEATVARVGLRVDDAPKDGHIRCTAMLEKIVGSRGGHPLLRDSLRLLHDTWGPQQNAFDAPMVGGMAVMLDAFGTDAQFDCDTLVDALIDLTPERVGALARAKKANGKHGTGALPKFVALTLHERYNLHRPAGSRLAMAPGFRGVLRAASATTRTAAGADDAAPAAA